MTPERIQLTVPGEPVGQPRHKCRAVRARMRGGRWCWMGQAYMPERVKDEPVYEAVALFKKRIRRAAEVAGLPARPWTGPVALTLEIYFSRPQRLLEPNSPRSEIPHTVKPDADNVLKAVMDALNGLLWKDDAQVYDPHPRKWYAALGCGPGIILVAEHKERICAPPMLFSPTRP